MGLLKKFKKKIEEKRSENSFIFRPLFFLKDVARGVKSKFNKETYSCIILEKYKTIWFNNPKVAGTSICTSFGKNIDTDLDYIFKKNLNDFSDYFKFGFVRNPFDRVVSCYLNQIKKPNKDKTFYLNGMYNEFWRFNGKFWPKMSFDEFVRAIASIPDKKANNHFKSQYLFMTDKKNNLFLNFIGRFETLEKDYKLAMKKAGIKSLSQLPKKNKTKNRKSYEKYYTKETEDLIRKRYKQDLKLFDYSF